jgi:hypothetical protein
MFDVISFIIEYIDNCNFMQRHRRKSSRLNTAIATNGLTTLLIARLDHREAIARLTLLKLIKVCILLEYLLL